MVHLALRGTLCTPLSRSAGGRGSGALPSTRVQGYAYCYLHRRARFIPSQGLIGCSHLDCFEYFALFKWQDSKPLRNKNTYRSCRLWSGSRNDWAALKFCRRVTNDGGTQLTPLERSMSWSAEPEKSSLNSGRPLTAKRWSASRCVASTSSTG